MIFLNISTLRCRSFPNQQVYYDKITWLLFVPFCFEPNLSFVMVFKHLSAVTNALRVKSLLRIPTICCASQITQYFTNFFPSCKGKIYLEVYTTHFLLKRSQLLHNKGSYACSIKYAAKEYVLKHFLFIRTVSLFVESGRIFSFPHRLFLSLLFHSLPFLKVKCCIEFHILAFNKITSSHPILQQKVIFPAQYYTNSSLDFSIRISFFLNKNSHEFPQLLWMKTSVNL